MGVGFSSARPAVQEKVGLISTNTPRNARAAGCTFSPDPLLTALLAAAMRADKTADNNLVDKSEPTSTSSG